MTEPELVGRAFLMLHPDYTYYPQRYVEDRTVALYLV